MMHRDVEVYVDDMIVKSQDIADHLVALERFFERIKQFRLRLNPKKLTFGVTSGKLLGYMVSERGIEVDPDKIRAIIDMSASRTEREIRGFLGRLQCINRLFGMISANAHLIGSEIQLDYSRKERAIYYLSKRMLDYEMRYVMIERFCLALVWATQRLRHYMTEYSMHLISRLDPLRYLFERPALKSIRGSIVADHLASLPISDGRAIDDDFPDEDVATVTSLSGWRMYFDGVANHFGYEIGILLISPHGDHIPISVRLAFLDRYPSKTILLSMRLVAWD
ncbi:hypothetical protein CK203_035489 [Vitis vinifera]|uniref:Reverse transcriptase domain-containing protein n=1 Tax=Vitis vinifera TaxID=29760 RepID=A0A438I3N0_VITVI|nr:hypothetical protein CK203_035489 [Vitis vinifera]